METFAEKRRKLEKEQNEIENQKNDEDEYNNIMAKLKNTNKVAISIKPKQ